MAKEERTFYIKRALYGDPKLGGTSDQRRKVLKDERRNGQWSI